MLKDIVLAIQGYGQANRFIRQHNLWKWILIPGVIYMLLFCTSMFFFGKSANHTIDFLFIKSGLRVWVAGMSSRLLGFLFTIAGMILWLILMLFYFSLFKYLWLIAGSPVFAYLSEKTEAIIEGKDYPFSFVQLIKDIIRGTRMAIRNTLWQTVYTISILILSFIPVIGWVTPVFALLIECYYYGFSMLDYSCERNKLTAAQSIDFIGRRKGLAIGNGLMFYLMHLVPVVGWVLAPAYAVIAATLSLYPMRSNRNERPALLAT